MLARWFGGAWSVLSRCDGQASEVRKKKQFEEQQRKSMQEAQEAEAAEMERCRKKEEEAEALWRFNETQVSCSFSDSL